MPQVFTAPVSALAGQLNRLPRMTKLIGLGGSFLLMSGLSLKLILGPDPATNQFVAAHTVVPKRLLNQAIAENYLDPGNDPLDQKTIEVMKVSGQSGPTFYIFDFQTPKLCGIAGCLYSIYTRKGDRALSLFLHTNLPKGVPLFQAESQTSSGLSCLLVRQPDPAADLQNPATVIATQYCYQHGTQEFISQVQYQEQILRPGEEPTHTSL
ncbi:MAG: hypothetical protein AAFQ89_10430 [Cyanobacteria bacterium J06626_18]